MILIEESGAKKVEAGLLPLAHLHSGVDAASGMKLFCCYAVALIIHRQLLDAALLPNGNKASKTSVSMATWK